VGLSISQSINNPKTISVCGWVRVLEGGGAFACPFFHVPKLMTSKGTNYEQKMAM
jgi:hypothetical protein